MRQEMIREFKDYFQKHYEVYQGDSRPVFIFYRKRSLPSSKTMAFSATS
jgi:hypothetical protein